MTKTTVHVRTLHGASAAVGFSGPRAVAIDRAREAGGLGIGYNGGELLLLAIGACYTNDVHREAAKLGVDVRAVEVEVTCEWGGDPVRAQNVAYTVKIDANAPEEAIEELIEHVDRVAEIHNSLRLGTPVRFAGAQRLSPSA